ncbi:site-specific integrase [Ferrovum myxofaciens]|uniref:site-specific integrase n=1 Tax=Ferrovum myxofaciens TaxID=416213 RepID=UPI0023565F75|nr:site-specific integrase [Ferrovum myxofaciens]MBU6994201.1 phage integrase N-terminal SAM-like domain-containing protein [Ferrovum myxofaciens]
MTPQIPVHFKQNYQRLLKCLRLGGLQPKTIKVYSNGVRRAGAYFDYRIDKLTKLQLTDYFVHIVDTLSWSSLKHDLYGLKFYYAKVLDKPLAGRGFGQAAQVAHTAEYYYCGAGATDFYGHAGVELPGIFSSPFTVWVCDWVKG